MTIAILGAGRVGQTLGRRWAALGRRVVFGSREPDSQRIQEIVAQADGEATAADWKSAVAEAEVVIYASPYEAAATQLSQAGPWDGKILVDCTNPINAQFTGLSLGHTTSAAEKLAELVPSARVVKAFNTVSAAAMADPNFGDQAVAMFLAGDDDEAKQTVAELAQSLGFEPHDTGPLSAARYLEPLAMLVIQLGIRHGWGGDCGLQVLHRPRKK